MDNTTAKSEDTGKAAAGPAETRAAAPEAGVVSSTGAGVARRAGIYLLAAGAMVIGGLAAIAIGNRAYAPEMYEPRYMATVAEAMAAGESYALFDLNINIRQLRDEQIKRMTKKPAIVILGASQWQEAGHEMLPGRDVFNAHVHRDYFEDMLGVSEMLVRHDKLPRDMVITIRDLLFTPPEERTDYLWLPIVPYYQAMAKRLSLQQTSLMETFPWQRPRELLSLPMLFGNAARWHTASEWPYPTAGVHHPKLDVLRADGSISWSDSHQAIFTAKRAEKLALAHADEVRMKPPQIDPRGVEAIDTLLEYLALRGVRVHLAHPPFNPIFYAAVKGSPYMEGLERVREVTRELAAKHRLEIVGSFDAATLGCTSDMFIDAEHSQAPCLQRWMADVANGIDLPMARPQAKEIANASREEIRSKNVLMSSGWMASESVAVHAPMTVEQIIAEAEAPRVRNRGSGQVSQRRKRCRGVRSSQIDGATGASRRGCSVARVEKSGHAPCGAQQAGSAGRWLAKAARRHPQATNSIDWRPASLARRQWQPHTVGRSSRSRSP